MHLSTQEQQQINGLVAEVEAASGAQFIVAVIAKADAYPEIPWKAFALATVAAALLVELGLVAGAHLHASVPGPLIVMAAGLACALLATFVPRLGRLLLDRERARLEVEQYARAVFLERGVFQTRERTGILVLISIFEREGVILPDSAVRQHVSEEQVQAVAARMSAHLRQGLVVMAAQDALMSLTEALGGRLARTSKANELAVALVEERGA